MRVAVNWYQSSSILGLAPPPWPVRIRPTFAEPSAMSPVTPLPNTASAVADIAPRNRELGAFLRARRENLDPARIGLPRGGRRRTPGLRREEVAQLANVSASWYTWLEQGRPVNPSAQVLHAIAEALQCSETETRHLLSLAGVAQAPAKGRECTRLSAASQAILDRLEPFPAVIQSARFDILGFNAAYCRLIGIDLATIPEGDRNCIYLAFTRPAWRARLADWDTSMPHLVAAFRAAMADHLDDPAWNADLQRYLSVSAEFRATWQRYEVSNVENQLKRFRRADGSVVALQQMNWWSAPRNGERLLVYVPLEGAGADGLECPPAHAG